MTEPPKDLAALTSSIVASQSQRTAQSQQRMALLPEERRQLQVESRISKKAWGTPITFVQREAELRKRKTETAKAMQTTQTARGQIQMHGSLPKISEK